MAQVFFYLGNLQLIDLGCTAMVFRAEEIQELVFFFFFVCLLDMGTGREDFHTNVARGRAFRGLRWSKDDIQTVCH